MRASPLGSIPRRKFAAPLRQPLRSESRRGPLTLGRFAPSTLTVVAEGVETKAQERFLREQGCNEIQGYLFSKPLPGQEFVAFAREHNISLLKGNAA